jgi:alkylhydroperoxidase/carboxymuconolactone decarboxylase family protein YurZ
MATDGADENDEPSSSAELPPWPPSAGAPAEGAVPETLRTPTVAIGALDAKTARLIAFAALIAQGRDAARWHAVLAQRYGASLAELEHAAAIASFVGGGGRALEVAHKAIAELRASSAKG